MALAGSGEGVEVFAVGFGQRVQVLLGGLNLGVAHAFHDELEVGAFGEQPGGVAWRSSCIRTGKSTPLALTAGSQTRVRNVLREMGLPDAVVNSGWSRPISWL